MVSCLGCFHFPAGFATPHGPQKCPVISTLSTRKLAAACVSGRGAATGCWHPEGRCPAPHHKAGSCRRR